MRVQILAHIEGTAPAVRLRFVVPGTAPARKLMMAWCLRQHVSLTEARTVSRRFFQEGSAGFQGLGVGCLQHL